MLASPVILIGSAERTSQLKTCIATDADVVAFTKDDADKAVQTIIAELPSKVILERDFAVSALGLAFIHRIRLNPNVAHTELLMGSHDGNRAPISLPVEMIIPSPNLQRDEPSPDDFHGTRRATRFVLRMGVLIHVDSHPATVIDMNRFGAKILFSRILRPSQQVRVAVGTERTLLRNSATVVWSTCELNAGKDGCYYRAGLQFFGADDGDMIGVFCGKHRDPTTVE